MHQHEEEVDTYGFESVLSVAREGGADAPMPNNLVTTWDVKDFAQILSKGKNILIHFWQPSLSLRQEIAGTAFKHLPEFTQRLTYQEMHSLLALGCEPLVRRVLDEMAPVLTQFAALNPRRQFQLSFMKTRDQSCPLFHIDRYSLRLLCTFTGPGTEWLDDRDVQRRGLGKGDNRKIAGPEATVYAAGANQVCLLKGEEGLRHRGQGVVHRSPRVPPESPGRWLLRIDVI